MLESLSSLISRTEVWLGALALAVFLVLFWALRGAAPGQSAGAEDDDDAPKSGYRDRVVAAAAAGLLLILAGGYLALRGGVPWSLPVFGLGFAVLIALVARNRRYRHSSPSLRRTVELSSDLLNGSLLAGVLIVANVIAFRYGGTAIDLTREQTFSLSSLSTNQVASLKRPVAFHLVFGRGPRAARLLDRVAQLLDLYRGVNPAMVKVDTLNPYTEQARRDDLARRAPDLAVMEAGGGVLIEYGEGSEAEFAAVSSQDMFESAGRGRDSLERFESAFKGEDAITSALLRLREARKAKVGFTTLHKEASTAELNPAKSGFGVWKARLGSVGCEVIDLNLIQAPIPDDLSLLVIAGPRDPFKPEELARIKGYADRGGPILALLDSLESSGLDDLLKSYNLELGKGIVIDPSINFNHNMQLVYTFLRRGPGHPIVEGLAERAILVPNGTPIHILGQAAQGATPTRPLNPNLIPIPILRTGARSWAETDLANARPKFDRGADEMGPITVGVAVAERPKGAPGSSNDAPTPMPRPRLVVFSSRVMGENLWLGVEPTNLDLLMNAASWLRGRPDALGISPKTHVALTLTADPLLRSRLVMIPTVMAMLLIMAMGAIVYVARRE